MAGEMRGYATSPHDGHSLARSRLRAQAHPAVTTEAVVALEIDDLEGAGREGQEFVGHLEEERTQSDVAHARGFGGIVGQVDRSAGPRAEHAQEVRVAAQPGSRQVIVAREDERFRVGGECQHLVATKGKGVCIARQGGGRRMRRDEAGRRVHGREAPIIVHPPCGRTKRGRGRHAAVPPGPARGAGTPFAKPRPTHAGAAIRCEGRRGASNPDAFRASPGNPRQEGPCP